MANLQHYDRLYGHQTINKNDLDIYQTPQFARLNHISLSAVPPWVQTTGVCASRAEHSRGVRFLAKLLSQHKDFKPFRKNLVLAATLHDIGSPPFSHISEPFQVVITGSNHEQFSRQIITNTQIATVIKKQGGQLETILSYIEGKAPPISDLINGSIDLDNLDNTLRFGQSMGLIDASLYYDPQLILKSFIYSHHHLSIDSLYLPAINSWEKCRYQVYQYVYSHENLAPAAMLSRALYFAFKENELSKRFFEKTDSQAFEFLLGCNPRTYKLIQRIDYWQFYKPAFSLSRTVAKAKDLLHNMRLSQKISDQLALALKLKPEDVCFLISFNKGFKKIHLPIVKDNQTYQHQPITCPTLFMNLYINPDLKLNSKKISRTILAIIKDFHLTTTD